MERRIIARGLLAGVLAGALAFVFARVFVEPMIARATEFEDTAAHESGGHDHAVQLFTRGVQANVGMGFGVLAFAVAMGALFAVVFVVLYHRVEGLGARRLSVLLAAGAFISVYLVPFVKYPPNPPAVGRQETIGERTALYLVMVVASVLLAAAAVWAGRRLTGRLTPWAATLVGAGAYVAAIAAVMLVLPPVAETPENFPADVLYGFRVSSLGTELVLWGTIGLVFAPLAARLAGERSSQGAASVSA